MPHTSPLQILHLEDDPLDAELIQETLHSEGLEFNIQRVQAKDDLLAALEQNNFDLILADFALPGFDGMTALGLVREKLPDIPFIFVSGAIGAERAIDALKRGATDYVLKHLLSELGPAVQRALREVNERRARRQAIEELRQAKDAAEQSAERIASLQVVTAALSEALTPDQVAQAVLEQGLAVLDARAGSIVLVAEPDSDDPSNGGASLIPLKMVGYGPQASQQWKRFPLTSDAPMGDAVQTGKPIFLESREQFISLYPRLEPATTRTDDAWAAIPLMVEGQSIGVMGLSFEKARTFSGEDREFMLALGRQCTQALERARLYEAEKTARTQAEVARSRLEFLAEASAILAASLDYETTLGQVAELAVPRLADWCAVDMLVDGRTERVAVAHVEPDKSHLAYELEKHYPRDPDASYGLPYVLRTGLSVLEADIPDSRLEENAFNLEHLELIRSLGYRSAMIVALVARGRVLGALTFAIAQSGRQFGDEDLSLAEELANRAALAVDNARLYSEASRLNVDLEQRVDRRTAQLEEANSQLAEAQKIAHLGSWSWDVPANTVTWSAELYRIYGLQPHQLSPSYQGFLERVHEDDRDYVRQIIRQALEQPQPFTYFHRVSRPDGTIRMLQARGEVIVNGIGNVVQLVGTALDVTELKEAEAQLERNARQLVALGEMGQTVTATLDLPAVLSRVLQQIEPLIPAEGLSILLVEPAAANGQSMLRFAATSGIGVTDMQGKVVPLHAGLAGHVIQTGHPAWLQDASRQAHLFKELEARSGYQVRSLMVVPLRLHGQVIGVIEAVHSQTAVFNNEHLQLLEAAANWTAIAISNARLYEGERQARRVTETLRAANVALSQTLELEQVLDSLLRYLAELVPYDSANVMLLDPGDGRFHIYAMNGYETWTNPAHIRAISYDRQNSVLQELYNSHQGQLIADTLEYPGWERPAGSEHVRSWMGVPLLAGDTFIGVFSADKSEPDFFTEEHLRLAEALAAQASIAVQNARLYEAVEIGREQMRRLSQQAIAVLEEERRRVSRELHDEAGQALTALRISLGLMRQSMPADVPGLQGLQEQMSDAIQLTGETMEQIRLLAQGLRPPALDTVGLASVVEGYCRDFSTRTRLRIECQAEPVPPLPDSLIITFYRFLQEALTNVVRHADATWASVKIRYDGRQVILEVTDNGQGFDASTLLASVHPGGIGLVGMRERLELLAGSLSVESRPGQGTHLTAQIPWQQ